MKLNLIFLAGITGIIFLFPVQTLASPRQLEKETSQRRLIANKIQVNNFKILGNTIFSTETLQNLLTPYIGQELTPALITEVSRILTEYYAQRGYNSSFARAIPGELRDGVVTILITESKIARVEVDVKGYLAEGYVRSRILARFKNEIFNIRTLEETIFLLTEDNNIENINIEVVPDRDRTGAVILKADVVAAPVVAVRSRFSNRRSALIGSNEIVAQVETGVFGIGDKFSALYSHTSGSEGFGLNYNLPLGPKTGNLNLFYGQNANDLVETPFNNFNADIDAEYANIGYSLPLIDRPLEKLSVGVVGSFAEATNTIDGQRVRLLRGADDNGNLTVTAIRFPIEYLVRDRTENIIALRSELSVGIDALGATIDDSGLPDSRFLAWRSSAEYLRFLGPDTFVFVRSSLQLAKDSLPAFEQVGLGGLETVRGYQNSIAVGDNGLFLSGELRYPLWRNEAKQMRLQLVPFIDFGKVWNTSIEDPLVTNLLSVGLGLRFEIRDRLEVDLNYGIPLINRNNPNVNETIQDGGFSFSVTGTIFEF
ncbi:MAG: ShlB/FhaC/HecB family hemolysin secretion/activation protein [Prochloraceae cyanobacterium]